MPRIRCHYGGCVYLEQGYCISDEIELDLDEGCLTFTQIEDLALEDEEWEEELFGEQEDYFDDDQEEDEEDDDFDPDEWN